MGQGWRVLLKALCLVAIWEALPFGLPILAFGSNLAHVPVIAVFVTLFQAYLTI